MDKQAVYFLTLSFLLLASAVTLSSLNENSLAVYFSFFVASYFVCSLIFAQKRRSSFDFVGLALLLVWAFTVIWTVIFTVILAPK